MIGLGSYAALASGIPLSAPPVGWAACSLPCVAEPVQALMNGIVGLPRDLEILLLGSGCSEGTPNPDCLTRKDGTACAACRAYERGDRRNARRPGSMVVRFMDLEQQKRRTILVDCGPLFIEAARQQWREHGLREVDAVLLTHAHDDATDGIGQLRAWTALSAIQDTVDIYCTAAVRDEMLQTKPWLFSRHKATGSHAVGHITSHTIVPNQSFNLFGLSILPIAVEHGTYRDGQPYPCLAFLFDRTLLYASDQHNIPVSSMQVLQETLMNGLPVLLGASLRIQPHPSHFSFANACHLASSLGAARTYLIEMTDGPSFEQWLALCQRLRSLEPDPRPVMPLTWSDYPVSDDNRERLLWHSAHTEAGIAGDDTEAFVAYTLSQPGVSHGNGKWISPSFDGLVLRVRDAKVEEIERLTSE